MKAKVSDEEKKAAAYYLGMSNLGQTTDKTDKKLKELAPDWEKVYSYIRQELSCMAESDEMYAGMLDECKFFLKDIEKNNKDGKFWLKSWNDHKLRLGILN